jgi:hypothetical protein
MQLALTAFSAFVLLAVSTSIAAVVAGASVAYLQAGNETGRRNIRFWAVWLGALTTVFTWAWLAGTALATPGMNDTLILGVMALSIVLFFVVYIPLRRSTRRRNTSP